MESLLRESQYFWRKFWQKPQIPNFCEVNELWHVCATPACGNGRSKEVLKAGLRGWPRLFLLGYEPDVQRREDENETEELMEQPEGTQEHGVHKNVLF